MNCRHYCSKDYAEIVDLFYTTVHTINATSRDTFDCLYVDKDYQKRGVGHLLANKIEQYCKKQGAVKINVDVSLTALSFFEQRGYVILNQQVVVRRNQYLNNYKMQLKL